MSNLLSLPPPGGTTSYFRQLAREGKVEIATRIENCEQGVLAALGDREGARHLVSHRARSTFVARRDVSRPARQVEERFGVTRERIRRIEAKTLARLKLRARERSVVRGTRSAL